MQKFIAGLILAVSAAAVKISASSAVKDMYEETHKIHGSFEELERVYDEYQGFTLAPSYMSWDYLKTTIKNVKP